MDLISEGFDCVVRAGKVTDPGLVSRPLAPMPMVNSASPAYLARYGTPRVLNDLADHKLVHYAATLGPNAADSNMCVKTTTPTTPSPSVAR